MSKTVNSNGMAWTVISHNERFAEHGGRFFFAVRCSRDHITGINGYMLQELDRDITVARQAKGLQVFTNCYDVWELSAAVREICGGLPVTPRPCVQCQAIIQPKADQCPVCALQQPERHPATPWDDYYAQLRAKQAA